MNEVIGLLEGTWQNTLILLVMVWTKPHERRCPGQGTQAPSHAPARPCAPPAEGHRGPGLARSSQGSAWGPGWSWDTPCSAAVRRRQHGCSAACPRYPVATGRDASPCSCCLLQETCMVGDMPDLALLSSCLRMLPGCGQASAEHRAGSAGTGPPPAVTCIGHV